MKRFILSTCVVVFLVFITSGSYAQDTKNVKGDQKPATKEMKQETNPAKAPKMPSYEERADQAIKQISDRVKDLTPEQKTKLKNLYVTNFKSADADREAYKNDMEKMRESAKTRFTKMRDDIKAILTKEQWEAYNKPMTPPQPPKDAPKPQPKKEEPKK